MFKALTGARAKNTDKMRENNSGPHIQNRILVAGQEVSFDVRFVGDFSLDPVWASALLKKRVRFTKSGVSFYVAGDEDYFYSLLYHILVQKKTVTNLPAKVSEYLTPFAAKLKESSKLLPWCNAKDLTNKVKPAWDAMAKYMQQRKYRFTCPFDGSVGMLLQHPNNKALTIIPRQCVKIPFGKELVKHPNPSKCTVPDAQYGS